jgi:DNA mismatch endonuclease (patch repair protein)
MPDVFSKRKRSEVMARIRSRGNKETEVALAKLLRTHGVTGWRRQQVICFLDTKRRAGPAHPTRQGGPAKVRADFAFAKQRLAVFVDGCFWHGCRWHCNQPVQNAAFWKKKLAANKARDRAVSRELRRQGWTVVRIWEHELRKTSNQQVVEKVRRALIPR